MIQSAIYPCQPEPAIDDTPRETDRHGNATAGSCVSTGSPWEARCGVIFTGQCREGDFIFVEPGPSGSSPTASFGSDT